uniref:thiamine pyrophosphate-binding protein n=1 Tax=Nocardia miyunensis TaxID=282684 RepID=UPI000B0862B2
SEAMTPPSPTAAATERVATTPAAHAVAKALRDNGIDRMFLVTGADLEMWRALRDAGIALYLARSEAGAVVMADAYARTTGKPAVVYGQWGPGAANVAAALADALWARSPVVALTTTVSTTLEHRQDYQELDHPPMFTSVTKWQARANRSDRVGELLARAIAVAGSGSPGPVHLDVPTNLLNEPTHVPDSYAHGYRIAPPAPAASAIAETVEMLSRARRPLILAGNGVLLAEGAAELTALAERAGVPVVTSMGGKGSIAESHPLAVGVTGRYSRKVANRLVGEADLVLAIGTDLGALVTDGYQLPSKSAEVIQVDVEPQRIGASVPIRLGVLADAREFALALTSALPEGANGEHATWREHVATEVAAWRATFEAVAARPAEGHVRPEAVVATLGELLGPRDVVVADTGNMGAWGGVLYPIKEPGRTFLRAAGTLGWGFPAVLGAQLAVGDDARAVALMGDGGFGYHLGDIETAVRLDIPAIVLVLNNAGLAYESIGFNYVCDGDIVAEVCDFTDVDYGAFARSMGAHGVRVDNVDDLRTALVEALAQRRPAVIDVVVSAFRFAPVTTFEPFLEREL